MSNYYKQEPTLMDVIHDIWGARLYMLIGAMAALMCAFILIFISVPQYRAEMVLAPSQHKVHQDIRSFLSDNTHYAVKYLVESIGTKRISDFSKLQHMMRGTNIASILLQDKILMSGIQNDQNWIFEDGPQFDAASDMQKAQKLSEYLEDNVSIDPVGMTGMIRLKYHHQNPIFAAAFLSSLHQLSDDVIRGTAQDNNNQRVAFLNDAIIKTRHPDHRQALTSLLMEEERIRMLLNLDEAFAASIVEPASVTYKTVKPSAAILYSAFAFIGLFVGFVAHSLSNRPASLIHQKGDKAGERQVKNPRARIQTKTFKYPNDDQRPLTGEKTEMCDQGKKLG